MAQIQRKIEEFLDWIADALVEFDDLEFYDIELEDIDLDDREQGDTQGEKSNDFYDEPFYERSSGEHPFTTHEQN
jgi:hypothetical protein